MRVYLDACCYNRPFDNPDIDRNHLEAEAVVAILGHVQQGTWLLIGSEALDRELGAAPDADRCQAMLGMASAASESIAITQREYDRSEALMRFGFERLDSLHVASAESAKCDVLLTTDDRLARRAAKHASRLGVEVRNPVDWLLEQKR